MRPPSGTLNHETLRGGIPFMGPEPKPATLAATIVVGASLLAAAPVVMMLKNNTGDHVRSKNETAMANEA